jgi:hypothetical protein
LQSHVKASLPVRTVVPPAEITITVRSNALEEKM